MNVMTRKQRSTQSSRMAIRPRVRRAPAMAVLALSAAGLLIAAAPEPEAPHATQFSPYVAPNEWDFYGCRLKAGPAYDDLHQSTATYHFIGAGEVSCPTNRNLEITVSQWRDTNGYADGGEVIQVGAEAYSGALTTGSIWMYTGGVCQDGSPSAAYLSQVYVTIDGEASGWLASAWQEAPPGEGCP
jgi:hypothetical protein